MKKINIGQTVGVLANLGVIAGIVILAIEVRQNNDLMAANARFNRLSLSVEAYNLQSANGELAEILVKAINNRELTEVEDFRASSAAMRFLINMEWFFREMPLDSPERNYTEQQLILGLTTNSHNLKVFKRYKNQFDTNFAMWIEKNIIKQ